VVVEATATDESHAKAVGSADAGQCGTCTANTTVSADADDEGEAIGIGVAAAGQCGSCDASVGIIVDANDDGDDDELTAVAMGSANAGQCGNCQASVQLLSNADADAGSGLSVSCDGSDCAWIIVLADGDGNSLVAGNADAHGGTDAALAAGSTEGGLCEGTDFAECTGDVTAATTVVPPPGP
jgi:hypothetical protein